MKFVFVFPGRTREGYLDAGIRDYAGRLEHFVQVEIVPVREGSSGKIPAEVQKKQEAHLLLEKCSGASFIVALDPRGREMESQALAETLSAWEDRGLRTVYFVLGGHYGLHDDVLQKADLVLSLSRMTFTHEMSRLILFEQLYRCCMINNGRSYHY